MKVEKLKNKEELFEILQQKWQSINHATIQQLLNFGVYAKKDASSHRFKWISTDISIVQNINHSITFTL